ncbi:uncharacterized protein BYT42DRAFT_562737 [Radiomyces spectabilis]|uniref:uncharacterized protein n=1 Tax=Radiomyces spectabilis TaxID=64574 RepID=UPI0022204F59|nr:uncharacterized protein BYT42DRAFT_562737 [Radiomyces spectabilis]KAI8384508.1 hypothetical protein BYT42DRAFT_562737 [Radiomyces spectabilis]
MSSRLAKQSLNLLLKSPSNTPRDQHDSSVTKRRHGINKLPDTNKGLKKIKYEIRYGRLKKEKLQRAEQQKKENPLDALARKEAAMDENLARNIRLLTTKMKATEVEKAIRKEMMRYTKSTNLTKKSQTMEEDDDDDDDDDDV